VAQLVVDGQELVVKLRLVERFWTFHGDVRIPLSAIRRIRTSNNIWFSLRGWRATGAAVPGYVAMGKRRHGTGYDFTVVFRSRPVVVLECNDFEFGEVLVSVDDALETAAMIAAASADNIGAATATVAPGDDPA
jgi:hypothetical protein